MKKYIAGPLLSKINSPSDLRKLRKKNLPIISEELRQFIIDVVSEKNKKKTLIKKLQLFFS